MAKKFSVYAINIIEPDKYKMLNSKDFEGNYKKEFNENCTLKKFFDCSNRDFLFEDKYEWYYSFFAEKELKELIQFLSNELSKNNSSTEENFCIFKIDFFDITRINKNFEVLNSVDYVESFNEYLNISLNLKNFENINNYNYRKKIFNSEDKEVFLTHKELTDYIIKLNNILKELKKW